MDLNDMIAGMQSSPTYPEYNKQVLSGVFNANSKQTKQQSSESSIESEKEIGKQSDEALKRPAKKSCRTSLEEYRQTFLQVPRITNRKPVFVSASTREQLDHIVRQLGDRKMSVSGLIENLALNHLQTYHDDIEQWRKL